MNKLQILTKGLIKENPTFVLLLGMCPTLAVTTSAINGIGMGLSTTVVVVLSNMLISMLRNIIPDREASSMRSAFPGRYGRTGIGLCFSGNRPESATAFT